MEVCLRQTGFMSKTGNISKTDISFQHKEDLCLILNLLIAAIAGIIRLKLVLVEFWLGYS